MREVPRYRTAVLFTKRSTFSRQKAAHYSAATRLGCTQREKSGVRACTVSLSAARRICCFLFDAYRTYSMMQT